MDKNKVINKIYGIKIAEWTLVILFLLFIIAGLNAVFFPTQPVGEECEMSEKWSRVLKALAALYERYYTEAEGGEGELDGVLQDLDELMQAYDAWLD